MSTLDTRALRQAFSSFTTGVTVVTSKTVTGAPVGFTWAMRNPVNYTIYLKGREKWSFHSLSIWSV